MYICNDKVMVYNNQKNYYSIVLGAQEIVLSKNFLFLLRLKQKSLKIYTTT